jgi:hypothetical protein
VRGLDEAERGDRLAGAGGVLEPEALGRVRVLGLLAERLLFVVLVDPVARLLLRIGLGGRLFGLGERVVVLLDLVLVLVVVLVLVLVGGGARDGSQLVVLLVVLVVEVLLVVLGLVLVLLGGGRLGRLRDVLLGGRGLVGPEDVGGGQQLGRGGRRRGPVGSRALGLGQERGQGAGQGVDLVGREHRAVGELRLLVGHQALEPEQQRELAPPCGRGLLRLRVLLELGERTVERAPAGGARREGDGGVLAVVQEALAHELFCSRDVCGTWNGRGCEGH